MTGYWQRHCRRCQKQFAAITPNAQFCCPACKLARGRCACGRPTDHAQCRRCHDTANANRKLRTCEGCGIAFRLSNSPGKQYAGRFHSRKCAAIHRWALHNARVKAEREARQEARRVRLIEREIARETSRPGVCRCGAPITRDRQCHDPYVTLCKECAARQIADRVRRVRLASRHDGVDHVCPNCGETFRGFERDVFCSTRCAAQLKRETYPSIGALPLDERNRIAAMVALMRHARSRLYANSPRIT